MPVPPPTVAENTEQCQYRRSSNDNNDQESKVPSSIKDLIDNESIHFGVAQYRFKLGLG